MPQRIEVHTKADDGRAHVHQQNLAKMGLSASVKVVDVYTIENNIDDKSLLDKIIESFCNPVTQEVRINPEKQNNKYDYALEIGFLPGVTDNIGSTAQELLSLAINDNTKSNTPPVYSSQLLLITGELTKEDVEKFSKSLSNALIQSIHIQTAADGSLPTRVPKVHLHNKGNASDPVPLDVPDEELTKIGKEGIADSDGSRRGPLGMSLLNMQAVQTYFQKEGRAPNDIELETIAQTWSEHCKHTIFASPINDIQDGIYKHYIKRATTQIRTKKAKEGKDFCVSVFSDNSGGIHFDEGWIITDKVETHNSPSALDPFGGAITGIVGVNRDCIGFGLGAKPIINRYGFCLECPKSTPGLSRDAEGKDPMLSPETIMKGVVHGVNVGGNCSGIPSPQGFLYFDERFAGKPLVFAGTVGLIPETVAGKPSHEKAARPGDAIVMVGGKVGRDGIHGATFSSEVLDEGSPVTAVQIGDPITQKKLSDALIKEIRPKGLYNALTDNGAGGLSSSIGEMARDPGGFIIKLDDVPLKYPGMQPWEIWISESQERMSLAVPPEHIEELQRDLAKRGVESWVIGEFTDSGRAQITWRDETIMDMDMDFLHDGLPLPPLEATYTAPALEKFDIPEPKDYEQTLCTMLERLNICSKEFVATQYDHNVQGSAVIGPIQGPGRVYAESSVTRPVFESQKAIILSQGLAPRYSDIDPAAMAAASLDIAVRNALAAGANIDHLAILDNFCWCSSDEPERLGQLLRASEAMYDLAMIYETPFISGKDSMFNDFKGYQNGKPTKLSIPPTLLISAIGVMDNVSYATSLDPKAEGDLIYVIGETAEELGASEYAAMNEQLGSNVPQTDGPANMERYKALSKIISQSLCASAIAVNFGGMGTALAKKAIASQMGMDITLDTGDMRLDHYLFSESTGRFVVTIAPQNQKAFEDQIEATHIGHLTGDKALNINGNSCSLDKLEESYKRPLREY